MTVQTAAVLKGYFNTGDHPTEAQIIDLIDTLISGLTTPTNVKIVTIDLNGPSALTTSHRAKFVIPAAMNGMNLTSVHANCGLDGSSGASSSGVPQFSVQNGTQNMLSTNLTIDASEYDSNTAAAPAVIDTAHDEVATGNVINIETVAAGTGVTYAVITLEFGLP
jgi:hypothetical protein